ncbi:MAG: hypothetical protein EXS22_10100 [Pedosphaera sp.]|nr:hypothetical protein [Pedosphaera sp.]MSU44365.1 hypothetical protein [Pedosphaera sp.]
MNHTLRGMICASFLMAALAQAKPMRVVVEAGRSDRQDAFVTVSLPDYKSQIIGLRAADGTVHSAQVDATGRATFLLGKLPKNQSATFTITDAPIAATKVGVTKIDRKLRFAHGGKTILEYQMAPGDLPRADIKPLYQRGGYLHPVFSPGGRMITDDFPAKHTHHHGIWFPWTKTEFDGRHPDFWNMGGGTGTVEFVGLETSWDGPVHAGFSARHQFVDRSATPPKPTLDETWSVTVYPLTGGTKPRWIFDFISTQKCAGTNALVLPQYHYGGLGFRGNAAWDGATNNPARFLTANGEADRVAGHATRARWCHIGGLVDGQPTGAAIFCHPLNFRFPQPMRIHPSEPFFNFVPQQFAAMAIVPGAAYVSQYRFVISDGAPDAAELDRLWEEYAHPATARALE